MPFAPMTSDDTPNCHVVGHAGPECNDLEFLVAAWPRIPGQIKATIRTLLMASLRTSAP